MRSMMRQLCVCVLCVLWCMDSVIDATIFGAHSDTPQFVSMAHDDHEHYKHYFAELLLAFEMTINGETCELVFVRYLFPDKALDMPDQDGKPFFTKYMFGTPEYYEVRPATAILYRPALFEPPPFRREVQLRPPRPKPRYWMLTDDIYGTF